MDGIKIETVSDAVTGVSILVYAESGVGKTSLVKTLTGKTLVIDAEGGLAVLRGTKVDVVRLRDDLANLRDIFNWLSVEVGPKRLYDNVVLDSSTEVEKFMLIRLAAGDGDDKEEKNGGIPTLKHYGTAQFKMRDYLRRLRDLRDYGVNVVVTALEMPVELEQADGVIRTRSYPMMAKKIAGEICGLFDVVAHLEVSKKSGHEGERFLRLDATDNVIAKNRLTDNKAFRADLDAFIAKCNGKDDVPPPVPAPTVKHEGDMEDVNRKDVPPEGAVPPTRKRKTNPLKPVPTEPAYEPKGQGDGDEL